jgi:hypothetical protein
MKIKSPLEQKMVQPLVNLHAEGERFPQGDSTIFLQMPVWIVIFGEKGK